jgi:glycosyltransferase involved in cell wall biosynthesis
METDVKKPQLRILTWHVHGNYLYYLSHADVLFYLPYRQNGEPGYGGCFTGFPWGPNMINVPAEEVKSLEFDCILFQSGKNYLTDQFEILSEAQRKLPKIFLEHDPPRSSPTDARHVVQDRDTVIVHVTHFNKLMWDNGENSAVVIPHGVRIPEDTAYSGDTPRGIVVINNIVSRGRRLGADVFEKVRSCIDIDIVGMGSEQAGGLGEIPHEELPAFCAAYRFFFYPVRYTSLGLAVCEAMMLGMPVVALAATEMSTTIRNGYSGFIHNDVDYLIKKMRLLLKDPDMAKRMGDNAKKTAVKAFNINRFASDWTALFHTTVADKSPEPLISDNIKS